MDGEFEKVPGYGRALTLYDSDHPALVPISTRLTQRNYFAWSTEMRIFLRAKSKFGFVDGRHKMPAETDPVYDRWEQVDSLVISWIRNSLSEGIVGANLFTGSAKQLWDYLAERYGKANNVLLYQIFEELHSTQQGNGSLDIYYGKLMCLWAEQDYYRPLPVCTCEGCNCKVNERIAQRDSEDKLMQFLIGLDDSYGRVRNQILHMDPLPSVSKAFSILRGVEMERYGRKTSEEIAQINATRGMKQHSSGKRVGKYTGNGI